MFGRKRRLAKSIRHLIVSDPEAAIVAFEEHARDLRRPDAARLASEIRRLENARENRDYLIRALAEGSVSATSAFELLDAFSQAGYLTDGETQALRPSSVGAHQAELEALFDRNDKSAPDLYRRLDTYRTAGYLTRGELQELERTIEEHLNPRLGARRLFMDAQLAHDATEQAALLRRYLVEFPDQPDYAEAASLYVAVQVEQLWRTPCLKDRAVSPPDTSVRTLLWVPKPMPATGITLRSTCLGLGDDTGRE